MTSILQSPTQTRRTNSLGRAKSSCQHCQAAGLTCDRARPQCFTCISNGTICPGYKLDLRWQRGVAAKGNLAGFCYPTPKVRSSKVCFQSHPGEQKRRWRGKVSKDTGDRHFTFVDGTLGGKRGRKANIPETVCPEARGQDQRLEPNDQLNALHQTNSGVSDEQSPGSECVQLMHFAGASREPQARLGKAHIQKFLMDWLLLCMILITLLDCDFDGSAEVNGLYEEQAYADQEASYISSPGDDTIGNICENEHCKFFRPFR